MTTSTESLQTLSAGRVIDANGISTHLHEAGEGPTVFLLHGSGPGVSAWANWRLVLPELAPNFHVIAYDQLGFGSSDRPGDGKYGRAVWTEHALAVIGALGLERVHLIGNSMGGGIALSVAAARPEVIDRMVLMGTVGVPFTLTEGLDKVWGYTPDRERMRELVQLFAYDQTIATDELVDLRFEQSSDEHARGSYEAMFPAPRQRWVDELALSETELSAIDRLVLLVHGYNDRVVPLESSLTAIRHLPRAELHAFNHCGHWVQIEQTRRFVDVVTDFLQARPAE